MSEQKILVYEMAPDTWLKEAKARDASVLNVMTTHLYRVRNLGATHVWLAPLYPSPRSDYGYDIADYRDIDRRYGDLRQFDRFVEIAHSLGIKVLMDLVLNHTSIYHPWFRTIPEYYCWSDSVHTGWKNLFDDGYTWEWDIETSRFYLHLFHREQADLNWFPDGQLNTDLVEEFRQIVKFWLEDHDVDGFRLDVSQALNKDFSLKELGLGDLIYGDKAARVLNAIFAGDGLTRPKTNAGERPFLMMECFDPTFGSTLTEYYVQGTPVDYVLNVCLKDSIAEGMSALERNMRASAASKGFMLDLESHDSPRMPSRTDYESHMILRKMFQSGADAICLYQGQELGLKNPTRWQLPDSELLRLDAMLSGRHRLDLSGQPLSDSERLLSRANARVPLPLDQYIQQERDSHSCLHAVKRLIRTWKGESA